MKRTLAGMIEAGEPLMNQAISATKRYHEAIDQGAPSAEVERLRLEAEALFQAVTDYAQRFLGGATATLH